MALEDKRHAFLTLQVSSASSLEKGDKLHYGDNYAGGNNSRNTLAYPTKVTDANGFESTAQYNYDMGLSTRSEGPPPAGHTQGTVTSTVYDSAGRIERVTNETSGAYTRFVYPLSSNYVQSFSLIQPGVESYSIRVFDGVGRVRGAAAGHPSSVGGYSGQFTKYDVMGRAAEQSNPAEITAAWLPAGDDSAGWVWSKQAYDWKGRPTITTNADQTTKEASYGGCGCAGGEVVTLTDEVGRKQKVYADVLGRAWKTEDLNWDGSVYRTATTRYNALDQVTRSRVYQGAETSGSYQETVLTYDGHARLSTKKAPVQTSATVYAYNEDDTVRSVTDARGAVRTMSYNARHLVTGISYSAPTGITPTGSSAFEYDAAGNRTWMTDDAGRVDYQYNALSQLRSETRQFAGLVRSYMLSYTYTLAGQAESVTDWQSKQVNYGYDNAGRLTNVTTPTPYADNMTTYASNFQYLAWGALKSLSYGNGRVLSRSYDARLHLSGFLLAGQTAQGAPEAMKASYEYYADGRIKFVDDKLDDRFDRAYEYDSTARLTKGLSGVEARLSAGQPMGDETPGPYSQVYAHDVWGNLTGKTGQHWSREQQFSATYVNDRRQGWVYDAAGNVERDDSRYGRQFTYDAAGRKTEAREHQVRGGGRSTLIETNLTLSQGYDGEGQRARREERRVRRVNNGAPQTSVEVTYYVRSSVLGAIIGEVNAQGQRVKGYVYANGQMVVKQRGGYLYWQQANPLTGSTRSEATQGYGYANEESGEVDPLGNDVGRGDPYAVDELTDYGGAYAAGGNAFDESGGGCEWNGLPLDCGLVDYVTHSHRGLVVGRAASTQGREGGGRSDAYIWHEQWEDSFVEGSGEITGFDEQGQPIYNFGSTVATNVSFFEVLPGAGPPLASRVSRRALLPVPIGIYDRPIDLRAGVQGLLSNSDCADFVQSLINKADELSPDNPSRADQALSIFDQINGQGGFHFKRAFYKGNPVAGTTNGSISGKNATVNISPIFIYGGYTDFSANAALITYSLVGLHETIHQAGLNGVYNDRRLAEAASRLPGAARTLPLDRHDMEANSRYWSDELKKHCWPR
jgi:YD repeat-containing protein